MVKTSVKDFNPQEMTLTILGKGKGTQKTIIDLTLKTVDAISEWLNARGEIDQEEPLFVSVDNATKGHRLTGDGVLKIVSGYCQRAGISKKMSPHRIRHSANTAALDATNGNVRVVKQLSRHASYDTLNKYDDNRQRAQREVSSLLSDIA